MTLATRDETTRDSKPHFLRRVVARIRREARSCWRRIVRSKHLVFEFSGTIDPIARDDLRIDRYEAEGRVDLAFIGMLGDRQGDAGLATMRAEFRRGSVLWIAWRDGEPAAFLWTRRGDRFKQWFVPLEPADIVTFAMVTLPQHRGIGIAPTMMRHVIHLERGRGGRAMIDCAQWNKPSIRAIEKVGYRRFGMMKPLPRDKS